MVVHVINKDGKPLMPCSPRKARLLLKSGKAKVVKSHTGYFTIQLLYGSSGYRQNVTVGIDTGSAVVPISAISGKKVLYAKEKILRKDVKFQLQDRALYRRGRRSRLPYRKKRFMNRVKAKCTVCGTNNVPKSWKYVKRKNGGKSKKKVSNGRQSVCRICQGKKGQHKGVNILPPSVKNKAESIINDIDKLSRSLPITDIVIEIASFDTQKMADATTQGVEYQQGTLFGEEVKSYLLALTKHKCIYCGGLTNDNILEVDHLYPVSKGGSNKIDNLVIACNTCNNAKGSKELKQWQNMLSEDNEIDARRIKAIQALQKKGGKHKAFQYSALTQSYKNYLLSELAKKYTISITFGYETKYNRKQLKLEKTQLNDALVIASGGNEFDMPNIYIKEKQIKKRLSAEFISSPQGEPKKSRKGILMTKCKTNSVSKREKKRVPITKRKWESEVFGFRLWDKVKYPEGIGWVSGRRISGSFSISNLEGDIIKGGITYKKLKILQSAKCNYVREHIQIAKNRRKYLSDKTGQLVMF